VPPPRHEQSGLRRADLAGVEQRRRFQAFDSGGEVGVVEHDRRGLPAELQADPLEPLAAQRGDPPARRRGPGEAHLVHAGVDDQALADLAPAGHDVEHPGGQAALGDQPGEVQEAE
jgi:hypothetical protein